MGTVYYFWILGGKVKGGSEAGKNKENIERYKKIFVEIQQILKDNYE